ncbi:hypothetical protein [Salidesulfovibrio brasiliensis]
MNENETPCWFDWNEIVDVFSIPEEDALDEKKREEFLQRINSIADEYGREYVLRKIALIC